MKKEKMFDEVVYAPKYNQINLFIPLKSREIIFETALKLYKTYDEDKAKESDSVFKTIFETHELYNLQCTYDKLIEMYLKIHPEKHLIKEVNKMK